MSRTAFVTGGGGGIGRAIIERLAAEEVTIFGGDLPAMLETPLPADATAIELDVTDSASVARAAAAVAQAAGGLDVLVNCAGIVRRSDSEHFDDASAVAIWNVNVAGASRVTTGFDALLRDGGCVVMIGSVTAAIGRYPEVALYGSSKAGLEAFTRYLSNGLSGRGIRVVCVAPGFIDVPMSADWERASGGVEKLIAEVPLGRLGSTAEVAEVVEFVASQRASYITGTTIYVDGGVAGR